MGFNAGDSTNALTVTGSRTPGIMNISSTSNVNRPGLWVFRVDEAQITGLYELSVRCT